MPTKKEREYYSAGFQDGVKLAQSQQTTDLGGISPLLGREIGYEMALETRGLTPKKGPFGGGYPKRKRPLNSWQKFVKANSKKRKFRFKDGKLKLKSMGIAYRKTAVYKRSKK